MKRPKRRIDMDADFWIMVLSIIAILLVWGGILLFLLAI